MKVLVAITGASGFNLGLKAFHSLPDDIEKFLIVSENAKTVSRKEEKEEFNNANIAAPPSSGSWKLDAMLIAPCGVNTLAKIACGIADNLISRSASVMIKENRRLVLGVREMPLSAIALENMLKLSRLGVVIAPPTLGYYSDGNDLASMENFIIGKWFDSLGIENNLYKRWGSD